MRRTPSFLGTHALLNTPLILLCCCVRYSPRLVMLRALSRPLLPNGQCSGRLLLNYTVSPHQCGMRLSVTL